MERPRQNRYAQVSSRGANAGEGDVDRKDGKNEQVGTSEALAKTKGARFLLQAGGGLRRIHGTDRNPCIWGALLIQGSTSRMRGRHSGMFSEPRTAACLYLLQDGLRVYCVGYVDARVFWRVYPCTRFRLIIDPGSAKLTCISGSGTVHRSVLFASRSRRNKDADKREAVRGWSLESGPVI